MLLLFIFPLFLIDDYKVKALIPLYDGGYWPGLASHQQPTILTLDVGKDRRVCIKEGQGRAGARAVVCVQLNFICYVVCWAGPGWLAGGWAAHRDHHLMLSRDSPRRAGERAWRRQAVNYIWYEIDFPLRTRCFVYKSLLSHWADVGRPAADNNLIHQQISKLKRPLSSHLAAATRMCCKCNVRNVCKYFILTYSLFGWQLYKC